MKVLHGNPEGATRLLLMSGQGQMIGLDLLQSLDLEILFPAVIALDTGHVLNDQQFVILLMDIAGLLGAQVPVAAKAALFAHLGLVAIALFDNTLNDPVQIQRLIHILPYMLCLATGFDRGGTGGAPRAF
jgi:hypothetical protein